MSKTAKLPSLASITSAFVVPPPTQRSQPDIWTEAGQAIEAANRQMMLIDYKGWIAKLRATVGLR